MRGRGCRATFVILLFTCTSNGGSHKQEEADSMCCMKAALVLLIPSYENCTLEFSASLGSAHTVGTPATLESSVSTVSGILDHITTDDIRDGVFCLHSLSSLPLTLFSPSLSPVPSRIDRELVSSTKTSVFPSSRSTSTHPSRCVSRET